MTRRRVVPVLSLLAAVVVAGCGPDPSDVTAGSRVPAPAPSPAASVSVASAAPAASSSTETTPVVVNTTVPPETAPVVTERAAVVAEPQLDGLTVTLTDVGEYEEPIAMAIRPGAPAGEAPYLLERGGTIRLLGDADTVALDVTDLTSPGGEQGVLGLAFAPDAAHLYLNYTDDDGNTHVDEFAVDAAGAIDGDSRREVLTVEQPYGNHNGGHLAFGPDGLLYIGLGDGGSADDPERRALDLTSLLGKMLRIDPRETADGSAYAIPPDNPFVGVDDARGEIWSIGLRNPWRYSFDRLTGDLWIGDVGQGVWEEIDASLAADGGGRGLSYGWSAFEGTHEFNDDQPTDGHTPPVWEYEHGDEGCSVTGGYVYRGVAIPALVGAYVFGDYCSGKIWAANPGPAGEIVEVVELGKLGDLASFGQDAAGELYVISLKGAVVRLDPA